MEHPFAYIGKILFYDKEAVLKLGFIGGVSMMPGLEMTVKIVGLIITFIVAVHTMYCNAKRLEMEKKRLENELKNKQDGKRKSE